MAAISHVLALAAVALCLSSLLGSANCQSNNLHAIGKVVCDPCRVSFETTVSYPLAGSHVRLECFNRTSGAFTYAAEAKTDANGKYQLTVEGDHEEEICEVHAVNSSDPKCNSLIPDAIKNARISLTKNNGVTDSSRYANHLFFAPEKSLENCPRSSWTWASCPLAPMTSTIKTFM
ncbi:hypothetical protein MLD38_012645 [Melastoma candidum]|uniref:Uncharacterized protein n=1 Tax=Melastoma candidum TaxID=119954 RepID=A0ACB9R834_9MYRT|nr:hypothetical protein MLD38_012645 [Melastoma candidum]